MIEAVKHQPRSREYTREPSCIYSYKLKDQPEESPYKSVFLKKDQHPDIRNEEKRLYEVFKAEKKKPENAHVEVVFNRKLRIVTVNGDEIDRF